jgi:hypothetical protein
VTYGKLHDLNSSADIIQTTYSTRCEKKNACRVWYEDVKERDCFDSLDEEEWIILKRIFIKYDSKVWICFI